MQWTGAVRPAMRHPAWHPDPSAIGILREWNGSSWSSRVVAPPGWYRRPDQSGVDFWDGRSFAGALLAIGQVVECAGRENLGRVVGWGPDGCLLVHHHNHWTDRDATVWHVATDVRPTGRFHHPCPCRIPARADIVIG